MQKKPRHFIDKTLLTMLISLMRGGLAQASKMVCLRGGEGGEGDSGVYENTLQGSLSPTKSNCAPCKWHDLEFIQDGVLITNIVHVL